MASIIVVGGVSMPSPSMLTWHLQDISDSAAGRTEDAIMHKNRIAQKWTADIEWLNLSAADVATVMQAFNAEYFNVEFENPMTMSREIRTFYRGDPEIPLQTWSVSNKTYSRLAFSIIER